MSERVTDKDLARLLVREADALGVLVAPGSTIHVQYGSRVNGNAYRIHVQHAGSGLHNLAGWPNGMGYMGWTAREACDVLASFCAGIRAAYESLGIRGDLSNGAQRN